METILIEVVCEFCGNEMNVEVPVDNDLPHVGWSCAGCNGLNDLYFPENEPQPEPEPEPTPEPTPEPQ